MKLSILRFMPNLSIRYGKSITAVYSTNVLEKEKKKISNFFTFFGSFIWVRNEEDINFFSAFFGGGPAYFFYILDCFNEIIKKKGFSERQSLSAIKLLLKGVLENINKENFKFSDSIQRVASKGGTTEEGLKVLSKKNNLFVLFEKAILSAENKSKRISKKLK